MQQILAFPVSFANALLTHALDSRKITSMSAGLQQRRKFMAKWEIRVQRFALSFRLLPSETDPTAIKHD